MSNSRGSFVTTLMILASLMLLGGSLVTKQHAMVRNSPAQSLTDDECDKLKRKLSVPTGNTATSSPTGQAAEPPSAPMGEPCPECKDLDDKLFVLQEKEHSLFLKEVNLFSAWMEIQKQLTPGTKDYQDADALF